MTTRRQGDRDFRRPASPLPVSVSLNGADNVGKTAHVRWLASAWPDATVMGKVDRWADGWRTARTGDFTYWWFQGSSTEEHVGLIMASHAARRWQSPELALEDRGFPMLLASCAATAAVKDGCSPETALRRVTALASRYPAPYRREVHVLVRHVGVSRASRIEAEAALRRETRALSRWYRPYQRALARILDMQIADGRYDVVIVRGRRRLLEVHADLRAALRQHGLQAPPLAIPRLRRIWIAPNDAERGRPWGDLPQPAYRELLQRASGRLAPGAPTATWPSEAQAELVTEEITRSPWCARDIVIRGVASVAVQAHLTRIWGSRCAMPLR